ncbi:hypothetical protein [Mycolicibacterium vulneris]|uniref:hypothetical protein n=1 Tax=Mycolicibacterium vulneris TaxID=547163 RepID=UPI0013FDD0B2|nr:hypothetical protein [Mycolicibacterium vulneris]
MSSGGAAGGAPGDEEVGAGLTGAAARMEDGVAEFDDVLESLLPNTTRVTTSTVAATATAPATHHGQRRRRGDGGYPAGGLPTAPGG